MKALLLLLLLPAIALGQSRPTAGRIMGGSGVPVIPCNASSTLTDFYVRTDVNPRTIYICSVTNTWTQVAGTISDGDKGDITVSVSGATWTIDAGAINNAKIAAGVDAVKIADGSVTNAEFQRLDATSSIQTQFDAKVTGPGSATDNAVVRYDSTTGKLVQNSVVTVADTTGDVMTPGSVTAASYATSATAAGSITISEPTGTGSDGVTLSAPASVTTSYTLKFPAAIGSGFIRSDGVDTLTFVGEIGSGNVVRATSPTLVTPALGTPSSGVVTNLTGTLTNIVYDTAGTGNVFTQTFKTWFPAAGCNNATAASFWDLGTSLAPTPACKNSSSGAAQNAALDFPDSDGMFFGQVTMMLPSDFSGTVDAKIRWLAAATSGDVIWNVSTICVADAEVDNPAFNTVSTVTDTAKGTTLQSNDATITSVTITGCAAGELMHLKISRDRTTSGDTITGVISFLGLELTTSRQQ